MGVLGPSSRRNRACRPRQRFRDFPGQPEDLVHGQEGSGVGDAITAAKAVGVYRKAEPTGTKGLQEINTKKDD